MRGGVDPAAWLSWLRAPSERRAKATLGLLSLTAAVAGGAVAGLAGGSAAIVVLAALLAAAAGATAGLWLTLGERGATFDDIGWLRERLTPLNFAVRPGEPRRVNFLFSRIDPRHAFAGFVGTFNLARRLADRGYAIRVLPVEPSPRFLPGLREKVESFAGLEGLFDHIEVVPARDRSVRIDVSADDVFVGTSWWTAHLAHEAARSIGRRPFLFLIQEFEPSFFPAGSRSALAEQSYRLPHRAIFSTEVLRSHFRTERLGVYAGSGEDGDRQSVAVEHAMTPLGPVEATELTSAPRLLFYARPEMHAARNMFELGVLGIERAIAAGALSDEWEIHGIGTVGHGRRVELAGGRSLDLSPRLDEASYAELLGGYSVGLALMHAPHPSLVPLEMAGAGMLTVTTTFRHKDANALRSISANLIPVEPTIEDIARGIALAVEGAGDLERRAAGSDFEWSRDWNAALDDEVMGRIEALIEAGD